MILEVNSAGTECGSILVQCGKLLKLDFSSGAGDANYSELILIQFLAHFSDFMTAFELYR